MKAGLQRFSLYYKTMEIFLDKIFLMLARLYLTKGRHQTVVITGSVGKTSVTQAIATLLSEDYVVKTTKQNYNTHRGVPLTVFDLSIPASRRGWLGLLIQASMKALFTWPKFSMLVLELGSDKPGDIAKFAFLRPDIAVVTATTPEHMEYFKTLDAVAEEELSASMFSSEVIINTDLVPAKFIKKYSKDLSAILYGAETSNTVQIDKGEVIISVEDSRINSTDFNLIGASGLSTLLASALVAKRLGMDGISIKKGLLRIRPVAGRMNKFTGLNGSTIIDDTYNSSPEAVKVALDYLYEQKATKRIALLGMMNEMGEVSEQLHRKVGSWCDPSKLSLLVTLGEDANLYLAEEAEENGCKVIRTNSPYDAGDIIKKYLSMGTVVLAKGSQNGVYAEEAVKSWLSDPSDEHKLVRQTSYWPSKKAKQFSTKS